ncbi:hypothetical protein VTK56DRAFT_8814 [Thermocarpiscus australiensis]
MGCGPSKPKQTGRQRNQARDEHELRFSPPQNVTIHIPRNRLDKHGMPVQQVTRDVDRDTLLAALNHVSAYLAQRHGRHISLIAVGGAVNTLLLRSRAATHDVDVFGSDFDNQARMLVDEAMHDAQQHIHGLGTDWLNTETQLYFTPALEQDLTSGAIKQGRKVYSGPGLTVYAAPWEYAFCAKVDRLLKRDRARPYDLSDAVAYIHEYIRHHGNQPVPVATAVGWSRKYGTQMTEDILRNHVDPEYQKRHGGKHAFLYDDHGSRSGSRSSGSGAQGSRPSASRPGRGRG